MTAKNAKDQGKTPDRPARPTQPAELETRELDKVVGGLKKAVIDDPCGGDD